MINMNNWKTGAWFTCDRCGKEYTFSGSFLTALKGVKFCPFDGEMQVAPCDLCRDCAGQTAKFPAGGEAQLLQDIAKIDDATAALP